MEDSLIKTTIKNSNSVKNHSEHDMSATNTILTAEEASLLRDSHLQRYGNNSSMPHHLSVHGTSSSASSYHPNDLRNSIHLPSASSSTITSAGSEDLQSLLMSNNNNNNNSNNNNGNSNTGSVSSSNNNNNGTYSFLDKSLSSRTPQFAYSLSNASMRKQQLSQMLTSGDSLASGSNIQSPSTLSSTVSLMLSNHPSIQHNSLPSLPPNHLQHSYSTSNVLNLSNNLNILKNQQQQQQQARSSGNSSSLMLHHLGSSVLSNSDYEEYSLQSQLQKQHHLHGLNGTLPANFRGRGNYGLVGSGIEFRGDYDSLRRKYADLDNFHNEVVSKLSTAVADNQIQKKKYEELAKVNKALEQQCQLTLRQWEKSMREIEEMKSQLEQVRKQRDEAHKECNEAMTGRNKAIKDKQRLYEERNTALHEYQLIMSERDTVHKEIERLQEDLHNIQQKNDNYEKEHKQFSEELETLRRELASSLCDRDMALKVCNDLKIKLGKLEPNDNREYYSNDNVHSSSSPVGSKKCEFKSQKVSPDRYLNDNKQQQSESLTNEVEGLRKEFDRLQIELKKALEEVEDCKKLRDWAFFQRDKMVLERESIHTLCDELRKERLRKVSDLAEALRESDEIKRQKNEIIKEFEEFKEKHENERIAWQQKYNQLNRSQHTKPNCTSQDSAIDLEENNPNSGVRNSTTNQQHQNQQTLNYSSDSEIYEEFSIKLCRDSVHKEWCLGLKFVDKLYQTNANAIILDSVPVNVHYAHGADHKRKLCVGDHIMGINHVPISDLIAKNTVSGRLLLEVETLIENSGLELELNVRRYRIIKSFETMELDQKQAAEHDKSYFNCYNFDADVQLSVIKTEDDQNILKVGDRIIEFDGNSVDRLFMNDFFKLLLTGSDRRKLALKVIRSKLNNNFQQSVPHQAELSLSHSSSEENKRIQCENVVVVEGGGTSSTAENKLNLNVRDSITNNGVLRTELSSVLYSPEEECLSSMGLPAIDKEVPLVDSIDSHDSSDSDEDDGPTYIGGDNAAEDADDDASTTTVESDNEPTNESQFDDGAESETQENKTIAQLDKVLEKYVDNDFVSMTSSQLPNDNELYIDFGREQSLQPQSPITPKQSLVRRSNRKKNRSNRCTQVVQSHLASEVARELAIAAAPAPSQSESFGDTWPRYKPHQLVSSVLPLFYAYNGKKLKQIYEDQGYKARTTKDAPLALLLNQNHNKKERKSLKVFADFWEIPEKIQSHKAPLSSSTSFQYRSPMPEMKSTSGASKCSPMISSTASHHQPSNTVFVSADNTGANDSHHSNNSRLASTQIKIMSQVYGGYQPTGATNSTPVHRQSIHSNMSSGHGQTAQATATGSSTYSPIYAAYSTYGRLGGAKSSNAGTLALGSKNNENSFTSTKSAVSQSTVDDSVSTHLSPVKQPLFGIYGTTKGNQADNRQLFGGSTSVDYSVVSAQTQDKNVLNYYKTRQISGSSQADNNSLINSGANQVYSRAPLVVPSGQYHYATETATGTEFSPSDVYGQVQRKPMDIYGCVSGSLYGTISGARQHHTPPPPPPPPASIPQSLIDEHYGTVSRIPSTHHHPQHRFSTIEPCSRVNTADLQQRNSLILTGSNWEKQQQQQEQQRQQQQQQQGRNNDPTSSSQNALLYSTVGSKRLSYKDNYSHSVYSCNPPYESNLSSRSSITSSSLVSSHHHFGDTTHMQNQIYVSLRKPSTNVVQNVSTPPPPAPPSTTYASSTDEMGAVNFNLDSGPPFNIGSVSIGGGGSAAMPSTHRFRIPSNSSNISTSSKIANVGTSVCSGGIALAKLPATTIAPLSGLSSLLADRPNIVGTGMPALSTTAIYGSNQGGIGGYFPTAGDRSSIVSSSGCPPPLFEVKWIKCEKDGSPGSPILDHRKAKPDDYRLISIEKSSAMIGIGILRTAKTKGVFVQMVTEGSLAAQAGIKVGDQIIEICGVNMRTTGYENAAKVLCNCGDSIKMLVQCGYEKFKEIWQAMSETERQHSLEGVPLESHIEPTSSSPATVMGAKSTATELEDDPDSCYGLLSSTTLSRRSRRGVQEMENLTNLLDIERTGSIVRDDLMGATSSTTLTRRAKVASLPHECALQSPNANRVPFSVGAYVPSSDSGARTNGTIQHFTADQTPKQSFHKESPDVSISQEGQIRRLIIQKATSNLGLSLLGGNAAGIFIHSIRDEKLANSGLRVGDQILEYNGTDLRHATAEEAAIELAKPAEVVEIVVLHDLARFHEVQAANLGDSFYIQCAFDRSSIEGSMSFHKKQVLLVDNTMYKGVPGLWGAWTLNAQGEKERFGIIPSRYKAEEELMMKRGYWSGTSDSATNVTNSGFSSTRRSFFRRRKTGSSERAMSSASASGPASGASSSHSGHGGGGPLSTIAGIAHFRTSSRDSTTKEIASYSDIGTLRATSDSGADSINDNGNEKKSSEALALGPEYVVPATYIHVEKAAYELPRPVIIIGPLKEIFIEKLEQDFPQFFQRCLPELIFRQDTDDSSAVTNANQKLLDQWLEEKKLVDYRRKGSYLEVITIASVKKICDNNLHALLEVSPSAVERLSTCNIYPVVVFLKFKSTRQIKDINRCPSEKLTSKAAKEMFEHSLKIESEFKDLITVTIPGSNLSYMCTQVKMCVEQEQSKALWL